jgi:CubicO group peptidase (beta-lactamase class C family)
MRGSLVLPQSAWWATSAVTMRCIPAAAAAVEPSPLKRAADEIELTYRYQGADYTRDNYLDRNPTTGLLIAHADTILFAHYRYRRTDRERFISWSMGKAVTAMLLGVAVAENAISSIAQPAADYEPDLTGSEYGKTPIRDLLHMYSGVASSEVYDAAKAPAMFNTREAPPGTRFQYAGAETQVLVVGNAVHMPLVQYLATRIWQPMGGR